MRRHTTRRSLIERAVGGLLAGAMLAMAEPAVAAGSLAEPVVHALLDVPYVSQTPELCGGAAVAMVLRYWGKRDVFPQDFAQLVGADDGGIRTAVLVSAVRDRGWQALVTADDAAHARIRSDIDRGRPLIALIEVSPRTYHYVVIVGSTDQHIVLHDPARAPFRVMPWTEFDRAWSAAGQWTMLVLPPAEFHAGGDAVLPSAVLNNTVHAGQTPCGALLERGVSLARAGDPAGAEQGLVAATDLCPKDPAAWLELAGLRFSQSRWSESQDLAMVGIGLAPQDLYGWRLVATSRYLEDDLTGALDAWNRAGEPRIDSIEAHGLERTRHPVAIRASGLKPRQLLTEEAFGRAVRRLRDLPVASNARMRYEPIEGGAAEVDVVLTERSELPTGLADLASTGVRALLLHEVQVGVAGTLGAGELATASWRWSTNRPRVKVGLALPSPQWFRGVVSIDGSWERETYAATATPDDVLREVRRRAGLSLADWSTSWLHWETGASMDRLRAHDDIDVNRLDPRDYLSLDGALAAHLFADRVVFSAAGGWWTPFGGGDRFTTGDLLAAWRSTTDATRPSWSAASEIGVASGIAPLALWQGAGTGYGRNGLLRAHPLLDDGTVMGAVFGREVANGSLEYTQPVKTTRAGGISIAGFVDTARAWRRLNTLDASAVYVDAGFGLRVRGPNLAGAIRIDIARGLRGGGTRLSAGWGGEWPR